MYKMMLTDQKESLHEVCAQWHEKHNKGNANYQSVITHHWMRSSNTPKKARCFETERGFFMYCTLALHMCST